jgi:DNA-binding NtrC family response regulator
MSSTELEVARAAKDALLVVIGDEASRHRWKANLRTPERDVYIASSAEEALSAAEQLDPALVFLDLGLPDMPGVRIVDRFREKFKDLPIIAVTQQVSVAAAVEAVRHGASDCLVLDDARTRVFEALGRALQEAQSRRPLDRARSQVQDRYGFSHMLTQSPRMLDVFDQIRAVAVTDATVLILGETGTGKELVSRAIHQRSRRKDQPFIAVNCGAFAESLLESELFGHERGSFTGAVGRREGLFEMADGGTLFLDELGETTLNVQVNLLRVLEEMTFRRVGGRDPVRVDVRIVAATNVDLTNAVDGGRFRGDLYYRLNVFPIRLPPLRERREDIPLLMRHFLDAVAQEYALEPPVVSAEALDVILQYRWPGNVRQLRAMCERWVIVRSGQRLERVHLPSDMQTPTASEGGPAAFSLDERRSMAENLEQVIEKVERAYLSRMLRRCGGHLERTADAAGISRRTLYTKMKQYQLDADEFKGS